MRKVVLAVLLVACASTAAAQRTRVITPSCFRNQLTYDSLMAIGTRLHPEVLTDDRQVGLLVGLLFDADCRLIRQDTMRQPDEVVPTIMAMQMLFPALRDKSAASVMAVSGFMFVGKQRFKGSGILYGILPDTAGR